MDLTVADLQDVTWIELAQDEFEWWAPVMRVIRIWLTHPLQFLTFQNLGVFSSSGTVQEHKNCPAVS